MHTLDYQYNNSAKDSFLRAAPFVEHLPNKKNYIIKLQKKKLKFSHMVSFCYTGG